MVKNIGTGRTKTRSIFSVPKKMKGKLSLTRYFQQFSIGDAVALRAAPNIHKGLYHRRFHGKTGRVMAVRSNHCDVRIRDGNKDKIIVVNAVHLVRLYGTKNN
ncbi:50S ribosomal protein L21e [Candidatus Woesearchaeota archaeon]|nr:50S ribosomal protein L21e [Candidatus Woesearchaeota archaeon]